MTYGRLLLIPASLGAEGAHVIPAYVKDTIAPLEYFLVENRKSARRYLRSIGYGSDFNTVRMEELNKHTAMDEVYDLLQPLLNGQDAGLLSEAGSPGVADPGAELIALAHEYQITVHPLVGPSSFLLALMASGMNGQAFRFHGYLPIDKRERALVLRQLEGESLQKGITQLFMETPYRNEQLLEAVISTCRQETRLCIALNLTLPNEYIRTMPLFKWQKMKPKLNKQPAVFLLSAR